ncbi:MAG: hypothetical protein ACP5OC_02395 [Thermoplasmata archaeon]
MRPQFLQFDNLDSLRDYWAVSDIHEPILNERDFSSISELVAEYYREARSSDEKYTYVVELARGVDIRKVAFEICARLVKDGFVALLPSTSNSVGEDLIGQHKKPFGLVIDPKSNFTNDSGDYSEKLNRTLNEGILHKSFSFPVLFLKFQSKPNLAAEKKIYSMKLPIDKNHNTIKLWSLPILLFVAGIVIYYNVQTIFLFIDPGLYVIIKPQQFVTLENITFIISYALITIGIVGVVISAYIDKFQSLSKPEIIASVLLFFLFLFMMFPHYTLIFPLTYSPPPLQRGITNLVPSSLLEPFAYYLSQVLVSPFWLDTWKGQIFLYSAIFLSISIAFYIILGLRENLRVSVIYITFVALNVIFFSLTDAISPLWSLAYSGSPNQEALLALIIMSFITYFTNLVVPVTCLYYLFKKS